jgi:hypothetical protein
MTGPQPEKAHYLRVDDHHIEGDPGGPPAPPPPPAPPSPPAPPPPPAPLPPPPGPPIDTFFPGDCWSDIREVIGPLQFTDDSVGWTGALAAIDEIGFSDQDTTYISSTVLNAVVGIEFPPPATLPTPGRQALNFVMRSKAATLAQVQLTYQYQIEGSPYWYDLDVETATLSEEYQTYSLVADLPPTYPISAVRGWVKVTQLTPITPDVGVLPSLPEVHLTQAALVACGSFVLFPLSPPTPPSPPLIIPQSPPLFGPIEPAPSFDEPGPVGALPPGPPLPPLPPLPPFPPGDEALRPNRDIQVRLWGPRPVFMQINEPLDAISDDIIFAPALVESYNEQNGDLIETVRARLEVGFTIPKEDGPWEAINLRFKAARSRPPQPEISRSSLDASECQIPAPTECPDPDTIIPDGNIHDGNWQISPLWAKIDDLVSNPGDDYISAPVTYPLGDPALFTLTNPYQWDQGWNKIRLRLRARARANKELLDSRRITAFTAYNHTFDPDTAVLPPGAPQYQIRWEPFDLNGNVQAYKLDEQEIRGTALLRTNTIIHAQLFLAASAEDHITCEVSLDGENYYGSVLLDVAAYRTAVVYYRIKLNTINKLTPLGSHPIALGLRVVGPYILTPLELRTWPPKSAFILTTEKSNQQFETLQTRARLKLRATGNFEFDQLPILTTPTLGPDWNNFDLGWSAQDFGIWDKDKIKDLRLELATDYLELYDDSPYIDLSALEVEVSPYCPGFSPLVDPLDPKTHTLILVPNQDINNSSWLPLPAWTHLGGDPSLVSSDEVVSDPSQPNLLVLGLTEPILSAPVPTGYYREWQKIEVHLQAKQTTTGSTSTILAVSTNYGSTQETKPLTNLEQHLLLSWDYQPGLTTAQISRLRVALESKTLILGVDPTQVHLKVVSVTVLAKDRPINPIVSSLPPLSPPPTPISFLGKGEAYSCGSLSTCGITPTRELVSILVTNQGVESATLEISITGDITTTISGGQIQSLSPGEQRTILIRGQVGSTFDPFPLYSRDGLIYVVLTTTSTTIKKQLRWFYIGL